MLVPGVVPGGVGGVVGRQEGADEVRYVGVGQHADLVGGEGEEGSRLSGPV